MKFNVKIFIRILGVMLITFVAVKKITPSKISLSAAIPDDFENTSDKKATNSPSESKIQVEYFNEHEQDEYNIIGSINIPSINVDANIQEVDINNKNEIAVPEKPEYVGWYKYSVMPGEKGLSIIDGHVDSVNGAGIFRNLKDLKIGDIFTIKDTNNQLLNFKVVDINQVPVEEAYNILFAKKKDISSQLNLITCGGNYHPEEIKYDDRIIVVSELI